MSEPGSRRGRVHDAEGAREAILNAAEEVFAEHGFDGARIDVIAEIAGYNKSLIFHYFKDKLELYAQVLRRADKEINVLQRRIFDTLFEEEVMADASRFKALLKETVGEFFDYQIKHPRVMRMVIWEMAEGWQGYAKIMSERDREDMMEFRALLRKAQEAGLFRSGLDPAIQLTLVVYLSMFYESFIPLFQMLLPDEDFSSQTVIAQARDYFVELIATGLVVEPPANRARQKGSET
ncbi:TetR family transcriptional regulator [Reticulibacter mediterranei]|uniref:TetR family transcriptional regulator n=1 Tax=Reticulibacter mediterranei TaxID=2778369 RepID=A0A8J3N7F8_9CHLR|nr:TetR/AcrR family transcriptional regulator [Reticulibacter mediterranei]GHO97112.1 TetR family transcriptional regulator [Reticulibacter mediterranei]